MLARPHQGIVMNSDFFRRHPVHCGIIPCKSRKEMGKQAISNLKSKKLCNLSHLLTLRREKLGGRRSPPNLPAWLRTVCYTVESRALLFDMEVIMRNIVVSEFVSLDNVMQAPGGAEEDTEGGFTHGGWTGPFWHDDIGAHFFWAISHSDALLLGRKTWQIHGGGVLPNAHR